MKLFKSLEWQLAKSYLLKQERVSAFALFKGLSLVSLVLCVLALLVVSCILFGFSDHLASKLKGFNPAIKVKILSPSFDYNSFESFLLQQFPKDRFELELESELILQKQASKEDQKISSQGVKVRALSEKHPLLTSLAIQWLESFSSNTFALKDQNPLLMGDELAASINLDPQGEEELKLIYPFGDVDPSGEMRPSERVFKAVGFFKTGYFDYDSKYVLLPFQILRKMIPFDQEAGQYVLQKEHFYSFAEYHRRLESSSFKNQIEVKSWLEENKQLFDALRFEKMMMYLIFGLMILISSFSVWSLISLLVSLQKKDVSILYALGLSRLRLIRSYVYVSLYLSLKALVIGSFISFFILIIICYIKIPLPKAYYLDSFPLKFNVFIYFGLCLGLPFLTLISSLWPALSLNKIVITEELRSY